MKRRIMVVDDSRITELQIQGLLADTDFEVVAHCENGEEAIARPALTGWRRLRSF